MSGDLTVSSSTNELVKLNTTDGGSSYIQWNKQGSRRSVWGVDANDHIILRNETEGKSLYFQAKEGGNNYSLMTLNGSTSSLYYVLDTDPTNTHDRKFRTSSTGVIVENSKGDAFLQVIAETDASGNDAVLRLRTYNTTNGYSKIEFGDAADTDVGRIQYNHANNEFKFLTDTQTALLIDNSQNSKFYGDVSPNTTNTHDLGTSSLRWNNLYVNDMHFSNHPENPNSVDGTWGDWTLQEGENDIYMLNNRTGKKYKMALTEVS